MVGAFGKIFGKREGSGVIPVRSRGDESAGRASPLAGIAAGELMDRYGEALFAYAYRRVGNREAAEDIAAETLADALPMTTPNPPIISPTDPESDPARAYLFGMARRKVADWWRKSGRVETTRQVWPDGENLPTDDRHGTDPEVAALRSEAAMQVRTALDSLHPDYREALLLRYADGCAVAEVAAVLGRTVTATDSLLQRARAAARVAGGDYFGPENSGDRCNGDDRKVKR